MKIPKIPDLRTALYWGRANWMWIIAWIILPTFVVLALMAWHRKRQRQKDNEEANPDHQETTESNNGS